MLDPAATVLSTETQVFHGTFTIIMGNAFFPFCDNPSFNSVILQSIDFQIQYNMGQVLGRDRE